MLESKAPILPVFYQVTPTEVVDAGQRRKLCASPTTHGKEAKKKSEDPQTHKMKPRYEASVEMRISTAAKIKQPQTVFLFLCDAI